MRKFWKAWKGLCCVVNFGYQNFLNISTMISFETFRHFLPEIPRSLPSTEPPPKKQEFRCVRVYGYFDIRIWFKNFLHCIKTEASCQDCT